MPVIKYLLLGILVIACAGGVTEKNSSVPKRDINAVLRDHDKRLLANPNVAGVYVGVTGSKNEPCLKVMLKRALSKGDSQIPNQIEGYPVITEVTGEIRPLKHP